MAKGAIELERKYIIKANARINEITNCAIQSAKQTVALTNWLNTELKAKIPNLKAPTIERYLLKTDIDPVVEEILIIRRNASKSSTAKYVKAKNMITRLGRVHGSLKAYLTITGRWAGRALQIQNFSKPNDKLFPKWKAYDIEHLCYLIARADLEAIEQAYGDVMEVLKGATRAMIYAPPGYKFIAADYSQVEARVTMWLANCIIGLRDFAGEGKIYEKMAGTIFDVCYSAIVSGSWERQLGKKAVLGCGFGMGAVKFLQTCIQDGLIIAKNIAEKAVKAYRKRYREVRDSWYECEGAAISAIENKGHTFTACNKKLKYKYLNNALRCELPSGRFIFYPGAVVRTEHNRFGYESKQIKYLNWKDARPKGKKWDYETIWGGTLFQHAVQAIAADLIANGLLNVEKEGYEVIFTVHDEGVSLVPKHFGSVKEYEKLLCRLPGWARGIPLIAEGYEGVRYGRS
jgi:DNA polymerase